MEEKDMIMISAEGIKKEKKIIIAT